MTDFIYRSDLKWLTVTTEQTQEFSKANLNDRSRFEWDLLKRYFLFVLHVQSVIRGSNLSSGAAICHQGQQSVIKGSNLSSEAAVCHQRQKLYEMNLRTN